MRCIVTLLFVISGTSAALSDDISSITDVGNGAAATISNDFVAQASELATEAYSNMHGGGGSIATMGSTSNETAELGEDKQGKEVAETTVSGGISDSSETIGASNSTEQPEKPSEATDPGESTEQREMSSGATDASESTKQLEPSETGESGEGMSAKPKR